MSPKELKEDVNYLFKKLSKVHKDLYKLISKKKYEQVKDQITSQLKSKLTKGEFEIVLMTLFSQIKDPHTSIGALSKQMPIVFEWIIGDYYSMVLPTKFQHLLGKKLITINGTSLKGFSKAVQKYIISNNSETEKNELCNALRNYELINYLTNSTDSKVNYGFEGGGIIGATYKKGGRGPQQTSLPKYLNVSIPFLFPKTNYEVKILDNFLYFRYSRCNEDGRYPMEKLICDIKELLTRKPQKIIVDLRGNQGGNSSLFNPLINLFKSYLRENNAKVYGLINRRVFSSGVLNTFDLKRELNSELVGQPTCQGVNHFGEVKTFELPNSKVTIKYSTKYFSYIKDDSTTIKPNVLIEPTIQEYLVGKDAVLDYVISE